MTHIAVSYISQLPPTIWPRTWHSTISAWSIFPLNVSRIIASYLLFHWPPHQSPSILLYRQKSSTSTHSLNWSSGHIQLTSLSYWGHNLYDNALMSVNYWSDTPSIHVFLWFINIAWPAFLICLSICSNKSYKFLRFASIFCSNCKTCLHQRIYVYCRRRLRRWR